MLHHKLVLMSLKDAYDEYVPADVYTSVLQAREGEYFIGAIDKSLNIIIEPQHVPYEALPALAAQIKGSVHVTGYIDNAITAWLSGENITFSHVLNFDADAWSNYAYQQYNSKLYANLAHAEPYYLKQVYTHKPKNVN